MCLCIVFIASDFKALIIHKTKVCGGNHYSPTLIALWITIVIHNVLLFFCTFSFFFALFFSLTVYYFPFLLFFPYSSFPSFLFLFCFFFPKIIFVNFTFLILSWLKILLCNFFPLKYYGLLQCFPTWFFYFFLFFNIIFVSFIVFNIELIKNLVL